MTDKIRAESTSTGPAGNRRSAIFRVLPVRFLLLALGAIALLGAIGCYNNNTGETVISGDIHFKLPAFPETGSNKIQVFTEMHYQPSYRAQEGPRLMPPEGSVPITGAEVLYTSVEEYKSLPNPGGDANAGAGLFAINCMVCHGERMDGQGMVMIVPKETPDMAPADLMGEITTDRPDGELYGIISFGGSTAFPSRVAALTNPDIDPDLCVASGTCPMPEFRKLLTPEERWDLVAYLRGQQGR